MAAEDDKINAPLVAAVGIASVLILVAIIVGLQVLFFTMSDREGARKDPKATASVLADYRASQQEKLSSYKVLDPAKKVYAIPIDRAMNLVVQEWSAKHEKEQPGAR
jgi:hypothetical protein